jgi:hypothetical protein
MLCFAVGATPCNCPSSGKADLDFPPFGNRQELKLSDNTANIIIKYPFI